MSRTVVELVKCDRCGGGISTSESLGQMNFTVEIVEALKEFEFCDSCLKANLTGIVYDLLHENSRDRNQRLLKALVHFVQAGNKDLKSEEIERLLCGRKYRLVNKGGQLVVDGSVAEDLKKRSDANDAFRI